MKKPKSTKRFYLRTTGLGGKLTCLRLYASNYFDEVFYQILFLLEVAVKCASFTLSNVLWGY